jgi:hypothetical protein
MRSGDRTFLALLGALLLASAARGQEIEDPQIGLSLGYSTRFERAV